MRPHPLEKRVDILEQQMTELRGLPERVGRVESQLSQLRTEMRAEFSAVRQDMVNGDEETRRQMRVLHEEVIDRLKLLAPKPRTRSRR